MSNLLERCLAGYEPTAEECLPLCTPEVPLAELLAVANQLRQEQVGDEVSYVVNRNINFTNVCVKGCKFCAFSRAARNEQAYLLDNDEIIRRARQAVDLGATEVCIQAGLPPGMPGRHYIDLCRAIKTAIPALHIHAFSPEEVKYGAEQTGVSFADYLAELKDAGLGSLPGTAAEVLDDAVRERIAPDRITTGEWIEVIKAAHGLGIPTTSTLMFGHVESDRQRLAHLELLRDIQRETGGFTEFVPLAFVHQEAPMFVRHNMADLRPGATEDEVLRLYAIARLMLGRSFGHIQASWVKHGLELSKRILGAGADDLGGTLMNESISTAAGAAHGQLVTPRGLRAAIREVNRIPVQRNTRYDVLRRFDDVANDPVEALDAVTDAESTFGSYVQLTRAPGFRFRRSSPG